MVVNGGAAARLVMLCGVLAGLFLMHGSPSAAAGCHRMAADTVHLGHSAMAADRGPDQGMTQAAPVVRHADHAGDVCVSTQGRDGVPLSAPGPLPAAVSAVLAQGPAPSAGTADGSRAPPTGGRAVLLQVCVART